MEKFSTIRTERTVLFFIINSIKYKLIIIELNKRVWKTLVYLYIFTSAYINIHNSYNYSYKKRRNTYILDQKAASTKLQCYYSLNETC